MFIAGLRFIKSTCVAIQQDPVKKRTDFGLFPKHNGEFILKTASITGRELDRKIRNQHNDSYFIQHKCIGATRCM
jgi:hypothetical protein